MQRSITAVTGAFLVALPVFYTILMQMRLMDLMEKTGAKVSINSDLPESYFWWCLGIGASMIGATMLPLLSESESDRTESTQVAKQN